MRQIHLDCSLSRGETVRLTVLLRSYLGDFLTHLSFPFLLLSSPATNHLNPLLTFLGPLTNYVFLRYFGGDREGEAQQKSRYTQGAQQGDEQAVKKLDDLRQSRAERSSFWPDPKQLANKWSWIITGIGAAGALVEKVISPW